MIEAIETAINVVALVPFWLFGLWWLLLPQTVIRFYAWFHGLHGIPRDVMLKRMGRPLTIRMIGAAWLSLLAWTVWRYGLPLGR
jgi:hypothetical protein